MPLQRYAKDKFGRIWYRMEDHPKKWYGLVDPKVGDPGPMWYSKLESVRGPVEQFMESTT